MTVEIVKTLFVLANIFIYGALGIGLFASIAMSGSNDLKKSELIITIAIITLFIGIALFMVSLICGAILGSNI